MEQEQLKEAEQFDPGENYLSRAVNMGDYKEDDKDWLERINYVIEENYYVGSAVNLPIIVQADSLEEMKRSIKSMAQIWVNDVQKQIDNDLFEFVESPSSGCALTGEINAKDYIIESNVIKDLINTYWRFDNNQQPKSSWHDKQDLLEKLAALDKDDEWIKKLEQMPTIEEFNSKIKSVDEVKPSAEPVMNNAHSFLISKGVKSMGDMLTAHQVEIYLEEYKSQSQDRIKNLEQFLREHEQWEADFIAEDAMWWPNKEKDVLNGKLYEDFLKLQSKRNSLKIKINNHE